MLDNSTPSEALHAETVAILEAEGATRIRVEQDARGWLVACVLHGSGRAGHTGIDPETSDDPRDMARRLIGPPAHWLNRHVRNTEAQPSERFTYPTPIVDVDAANDGVEASVKTLSAPEPEPAADALATDAPSESPPATDGGSFSAGTMIDTRAGIMAADRTDALRAQRMGEVFMSFKRKTDARFPPEHSRYLQQLRSRSNAAAAGDGVPLNGDEQADLDTLAIDEKWWNGMRAERDRRDEALATASLEFLEQFDARGGWPE